MNWLTDSIIRIKNAGAVEKKTVEIRGTKLCLNVLKVLKEEGFIKDFYENKNDNISMKQSYNVDLFYYENSPLIKEVRFVSTSKNRVYKTSNELKKYMHEFKFCVVSTNKGVMACKDAIENNLGGEVLFWLGSN